MWLRALAFVALSLCAAPSWGQVVFDAANYAQCGGCSSLSFSHTTAAGSNRAIAVGVMGFEAAGCCDNFTGVTYNTVALTQQCTFQTSASTPRKIVEWWYLPANATGANTVLLSATGVLSNISGGSITGSGVNQATPLGTCANATGNSATPSEVVTSATNDLVLDVGVIDHTGTLTVGAGQTQQWNNIDGGGSVKNFGSTEAGAASVTMDWSNSIGTPNWIVAGVSLKQASAVATLRNRLLLGVGQ